MRHYRLAGILTLSIGLSCLMPASSVAEGPGDLLEQREEQENQQGENGGGVAETGSNDISLMESSNPIVNVAAQYTYDQMAADLDSLQRRYEGRIRIGNYGTSLDGRALYEVIIGNPEAQKHVLIQAGIHGREYMTPLLVMKQIETALEFGETASYRGQPLAYMLDKVQVHFLPMTNPDGVTISQMGLSGLRSEELRQIMIQGYQRDLEEGRTDIPIENYLPYCKGNGRGVDLNVNFPAAWEQIMSSPGHASYMLYKGESPGSEPETEGMMEVVKKHTWSASISYHSRGEVIYWDYEENKVRDQSRELAELFVQSTGYRLLGSDGKGGFKDWMQARENPVPSLTIETGIAECPMPVSQWPRVWSRNKTGWADAIYYAWTH
ncbi:M14 family zinc carboxypeptidase [Lachnospiraceae bacterium 62-35]